MKIARITTWFAIGITTALLLDILLGYSHSPAIKVLVHHISIFMYVPVALAFSLTANGYANMTPPAMFFFLLLCFEPYRGANTEAMLSVAVAYAIGYGGGRLAFRHR